MLKKFVFMLIIVFTAQLNWAVASAYCMHETDKTAQHFGHHPHQHQAADGDAHSNKSVGESADQSKDKSKDTSPIKKADSHPDCASCAHSPLGNHSSGFLLHQPSLDSYQLLAASLQAPSPFLGQPERPKWMPAYA
ncbi:hypothetical protein H8L32_11220 [Undibacterium sp. CY18W]|uniref:Cobalt-zinc-cadmium resistance protein CzcI n=1 Tax=Undibacterium hunanense TaxID=2762292 RepID=A0ABR6ZQD5_9BURK|nr:hypothetical protein [Undibacterium hunanense]MBC3918048.1 hypothetical protein [Undibacterium hunanense]